MKHFPLMLATLLGVPVSAPAQDARSGRSSSRYVATRPAPSQAYRQGQQPASAPRSARRVAGARVSAPGRRAARVVAPGPRRASTVRGPFGFGRWVTRCEQVLVPGRWERRLVPAVYGWVYGACWDRHWGVVSPASYQQVWVPARYETQRRRVWVRC